MKTKLERIREVLNLDAWREKQKKIFRRRLIAFFAAIALITGAVLFFIYYG